MAPFRSVVVRGAAAVGVVASVVFAFVQILEHPVWAARGGGAQGRLSSFTVCIGPDRVLRAVRDVVCPSGQFPLPLMRSTSDTGAPSEPAGGDDQKPTGSPKGHADRLADLERRLADLRGTLFRVVDRGSKTIFSVTSQTVALYYDRNKVLEVRAEDLGGSFHASSTDGSVDVSMGSSDLQGGLEIKTAGERQMDLGVHPEGTASLRFFATGKTNPVSGIGESKLRTGAIVVGTGVGDVRASLTIQEGPGALSIFNSQDTNVVSFRESELKAGFLSIGDSGGREAVKLVVNENRYGGVLAGPTLGLPYVPASGLPGSYFFGCAGGPRCYGF
jgi:hypothetical protein